MSTEERIGAIYWGYETAESELTNKTMVKIVVLVGNFGFGIVVVMTQFLRKFIF